MRDDLREYRWHTGAPLRPLAPDEPCPVLFRDLGLWATAQFLRGDLRRLAGPHTPLTYLRTLDYVEPYTDHERIGRLVFLQPRKLQPWHSGCPHVYVARAKRTTTALGFVPGDVPLAHAADLARGATDADAFREALGGEQHDEARAETLHHVEKLFAELVEKEARAAPLRRWLQASDGRRKEAARAELQRLGLTAHDLGTAWHHLSRERRAFVKAALQELSPCFCEEPSP